MNKPKVKLCWNCGKKLRGNHKRITEVDGFTVVLHKSCAKEILDMQEAEWDEEDRKDFDDLSDDDDTEWL